MAFWNRNRKDNRITTAAKVTKTWHTPGGSVQRLSDMVFNAEHTLIAGTTGCGKSTLLHGIMRDLLRSYAPCEARLVLIDPKRVELSEYKDTPFCELYTNTEIGAVDVLRQVEDLMYRRYSVMESRHERKYSGSKYFVVIDELAPLMIKAECRQVLPLLQNILQLGRAAGIHVIACTQAPNRKVIPAELVLNFSMRIGMRCLSAIESRQIIGIKGCEDLPLHGRAYVVYGCEMYTSTIENTDFDEVEELVSYWNSDRCYSVA